jgi:hypothetical protein
MAAQVLMLKRVPEAALSVVEAISEWRKCNLPLGKGGGKIGPTRRKGQQQQHQQQQARSHHPPRPFIWRGKNVLLALPTALEFLENVQPLREWLTAELRVQPQPRSRASQCQTHPFRRNPFLSAASIPAADDDSRFLIPRGWDWDGHGHKNWRESQAGSWQLAAIDKCAIKKNAPSASMTHRGSSGQGVRCGYVASGKW